MTLEKVLQALYDSEINVKIEWLWDGGFDVEILGSGDGVNGMGITFPRADLIAEFLIASAKTMFPESKFAEEWKD